MTARTSRAHRLALVCVLFSTLAIGEHRAYAQTRDSLLNGAVIGTVLGAGAGVAFTHAVRDSDLSVGQYAYGGLIFGAIGAGIGVGVDALLSRAMPGTGMKPKRVLIAPAVWRRVGGVVVKWKW
jgi:hypothetical protein